jgi:CBS domain-containing protein
MPDRQTLRDLMTAKPIVLDDSATVCEAARQMKANDVGDVLVRRDGRLCGIVTDRDLVVRALADERENAGRIALAEICSSELECLSPDAEVGDAIALMEQKAIRRIPVVENGQPLGIVSLGDLAIARDRESLLGKISAAPPQQ